MTALCDRADVELVLSRLLKVRRSQRGWVACCPAHDDRAPSLSLRLADSGRLLVCCFSGCSARAITEAIGLPLTAYGLPSSQGYRRMTRPFAAKPRIVATYSYTDESGEVLYETVRMDPKDFRQRRPDHAGGWIWNLDGVRKVPYNLHEILARREQPIIVVEGEKDAETLRTLGLVGTTNVCGAGKWLYGYGEHFYGRRVAILPDNDLAGLNHAMTVAGNLVWHRAASVRMVKLPDVPQGGDLTDWLEAFHADASLEVKRDAIVGLIRAATEWRSHG